MAQQMVVILTVSLTLLLAIFFIQELQKQPDLVESAIGDEKIKKLQSIKPLLEIMNVQQIPKFIDYFSRCHEGYTLTEKPFQLDSTNADTEKISSFYQEAFSLGESKVRVGLAELNRDDFSYNNCERKMSFPITGIVISIQLTSGQWLNAEVHPHEFHVDYIFERTALTILAFTIIASCSIFLIGLITRPLNDLRLAAQNFAHGLNISPVKESGSLDIRETMKSFNSMQHQVADEIKKRTTTLAAISHDIRTPLTALRIKAELIDDLEVKENLVSSINKMEKITASGLDFLRGENREENFRLIDLVSLVESECIDFIELGSKVHFTSNGSILLNCRPVALARALKNLIENAIKYAGEAFIEVRKEKNYIFITVADQGEGIPEEQLDFVVEPFNRLSSAREDRAGGFGLGLAIVKSIIQGHNGEFILKSNFPHGLLVTIKLEAR